jgi:cytoskeletal protein CcmA (bactofilin family)
LFDLTFDSASIYHYCQDGLGQNLGRRFRSVSEEDGIFRFESKVKEQTMIWKKSDEDNPPTQTPIQPLPKPSIPRSQPPSNKERALIGSSIKIEGNLSGGEDLFVEGRVKGKIDLNQHNVTIGSNGRIKADIHGRSIVVMGEVEGNIYGSEQIVLQKSSKVRGNLFAARVSLEDGSDFKGSIDMTSKPAEEAKPLQKDKPAGEAKPLQKDNTAVKPPSHQLPRQDKTEDKV